VANLASPGSLFALSGTYAQTEPYVSGRSQVNPYAITNVPKYREHRVIRAGFRCLRGRLGVSQLGDDPARIGNAAVDGGLADRLSDALMNVAVEHVGDEL
jgi:hypothetical protein